MSYLRNRPFLVISFTYVPAAGQNTSTKGFGKTAEWDPIENVVIVDRISDNQMRKAELIIDLLEMKVIKCRDNSLDRNDLMKVFIARYAGEIKSALASWVAKNPDNLEKVRAFADRFGGKDDLETRLKEVMASFAFEKNDATTRQQVKDDLTKVITDDSSIEESSVICDETNNTVERIENNELWADVGVKRKGETEFTYYPLRHTKEGVHVESNSN